MISLAIIQFGAADDVSKGYQRMCAEKRAKGYHVRCMDMLALSDEDLAFLASKDLYQINIVGHSATWDEKGCLIPIKARNIGAVTLEQACNHLFTLGKTTSAQKFNFYPCEIADKKLDSKKEMRDQEAINGILCLDDEEIAFNAITPMANQLLAQEQQSPESLSSFDKLSQAILEGRSQSLTVQCKPISIGGQVGPGDPERAKDPSSPRGSIRRESARELEKATSKARKLEIMDAINKAQKIQSKLEKPSVTWVNRNVTLFKEYNTVEMGNEVGELMEAEESFNADRLAT